MTFKREQATQGHVNYDPRSAANRLLVTEQTLANWRHQRKGPPYLKLGGKIIYREVDLLAYENENRIDPEALRRR